MDPRDQLRALLDGVGCTVCASLVPAERIRILAHRDDLAFVELSCPGCGSTTLGMLQADIIGALDGPIGVTDCSTDDGCCDIERSCVVKRNWRRINHVVLDALKGITLAEMARPLEVAVHPVERRRPALTEHP